jgi:chorismate lyase
MVEPIWEATAIQIQDGLPPERLSLSWQLLLLNDGYTTRNLRILSRSKITSRVINSVEVKAPSIPKYSSLTLDLKALGAILEQRQVWLSSVDHPDPLLYAISWWDPEQLKFFLPDPALPIGESLSRRHLETYRDIKGVYLGLSKKLEHLFCYSEPFWARYYLLWWNQQPLTLIYEVFSPRLSEYLGQ